MTIESIATGDSTMDSIDCALEAGLWKDRVIDANQNDLNDVLIENAALQTLQNEVVIPGNFFKSLKMFWQKHKVKILAIEETIPWKSFQEIPVFSSKNYPSVTDKFAWVCKMIDWGLSENEFEMTSPLPVLENATSQVFRTEGIQRRDFAVGGINGINVSLYESIRHAEYLAQFANGLSVTWIHNHSNGVLVDLGECALNFSGTSPNTKNLEREQWIAFHEANRDNPEAKYLQYCHSQGAVHIQNTLKSLPREIRQRVIVVAIAPAAIITDDLCYRSFNYASKLDKVYLAEMMCKSLCDLELGKQALENIEHLILLEPHDGATGIDHDFESPTFAKTILYHLESYLQSLKVE